ncbi:unnamed protein product, partial [Rotaria sp. Silwood2]
MSGAFSSVVNFTTEQFLKRAGKLSVLTELENKSESGQLNCPLQFPKHHKRRQKKIASKKLASNLSSDFLTYDNIQTTISRAFDHAYHLLSGLDVNIALEKKKKTTLKQVSSFVRTQFEKKFKTISADSSQIYSSDDESDDESESDVYMLSKPEEYSSSEDETDDVPQITTN